MIARYGASPKPGQTYVRRPGAYAIIWDGRDLLLTYQDAPHYELQLPGGGIDPGETPQQALFREVREETGWKIKSPRWFGTYRHFAYMPEYDLWAEKICHIFFANPAICLGPPSEADHEAVWSRPADAAPLLASPGDRAMLCQAFGLTGR